MDTASYVSAREAARRLGTSVPRVKRAVERSGMRVERGPGDRVRLRGSQLERLRRELGRDVPLPGLSKTEARVLAGLAGSPRGLPSVRAAALRAGVSPTAAGRAVNELERKGLLRRERTFISAGRAKEVDLLTANVTAPSWSELAPSLAMIEPPHRGERPKERRVPARLRHLFWNTDPAQLYVDRAGGYIARRLIQTGDLEGLAWGADALGRADWLQAAKARGLRPEDRALAHNLAGIERH